MLRDSHRSCKVTEKQQQLTTYKLKFAKTEKRERENYDGVSKISTPWLVENVFKNPKESLGSYIVKTIDRLVCIFRRELLCCFPSKPAIALTNHTSIMGTYGWYCCIFSTIKKPCFSPLQPRFQWKARDLFCEKPANFSARKTCCQTAIHLFWKAVRQNQEDCEVWWIRTSALRRYNRNCGSQNRSKIKSCNIPFTVKREYHTNFARKSYPY